VAATLTMLGEDADGASTAVRAGDWRSSDAELRRSWLERSLAERPALAERRYAS
jgi:hypothetical protein